MWVWQRPWRWLIAVVVAAIVMGLMNQAAMAIGTSEYFGLGSPSRAVIFVATIAVLSAFVLPSYEKMDQGDPLPPLPDIGERSRR